MSTFPGFSVLHPDLDRDQWLDVLHRIGSSAAADPHLSPWYLQAETLVDDKVIPFLAVYAWEHYLVAKPLVMRPVIIDARYYGMDLTSPHGYGGPVSNHGAVLHQWFEEALIEWAKGAGVICEYCALNPMHLSHQMALLGNWRNRYALKERKQVVWMDLRRSAMDGFTDTTGDDYLLKRYHDNRRAGIKTADRLGVNVQIAGPDKFRFVAMYRDAMERKAAPERWRFPDAYIETLLRNCMVFSAFVENDPEPEASALVMVGNGQDVAYYHMAANRMNHPRSGANDFLVHRIAAWCAGQGFRRLHLGGGVTPAIDDGVMFFKSGFSDLRAPAASAFRIFDQSKYVEACRAKVEHEIEQTGQEFPMGDFLPMYRREAA